MKYMITQYVYLIPIASYTSFICCYSFIFVFNTKIITIWCTSKFLLCL